MNHPQDKAFFAAMEVVEILRGQSATALLAGGCVRDMLLRVSPKDYDVATDATPGALRRIFPKARLVGAKFGVVLVRHKGQDIEVATFRKDGVYSDGRHPDEVTFGGIEDDAMRRDFTINGLFYDPVGNQVIDHVGGRADIEARVVRTIGEPNDRFAEDYLRMLRAPRFAARLGFEIEAKTAAAIRRLVHHLREISAERIWMELERILVAPTRARGFSLLVELGLCEHLTPNTAPSSGDSGYVCKVLAALGENDIDASLAVAGLASRMGVPGVRGFCRSLRVSNRVTDDACWLVGSLGAARKSRELELADLKLLMAHRAWPLLPPLLRAVLAGEDADPSSHAALVERAASILPEAVQPQPLLSGDDLAAMGVTPGPRFGEILSEVYRSQLNETITTREEARLLAEGLISSGKSSG